MAMTTFHASAPLVKAESVSSATTISAPQCVRVSSLRRRVWAFSLSSVRLHRPLARQFHGSLRTMWKSPVNKVAVDGSSNAAAVSAPSLEVSSSEEKEVKPAVKAPPSASTMTEESITAFMEEVANLVKLVDSRDIMELHLKQQDCELLIRKKEALPQPPPPPQQVMVHAPYPTAPAPPPPTPAAPAPSTAIVPAAPSAPKESAPARSGHPPLKSPMAGTFYRSPAPGEPPFVKVGDQVRKGQVLCIIEAMKLMNEIEADRAGTIAEIIAEDRKPVSIDTPLFVIAA
ncbi:biotin carboxyl carrier protein of acetyl-CoA carboxylase, chloroplastic isoform X2 [Cryptomeria japonica]|uniref:biotin carboxyl carrier protein of acetyl-CoA carboxylase, chloroplastic isoform X2 n=1 Tax=Cryptomeria japonica TaxID=3369 RepID=UPI0027DA75DA|nr:biotin carboxyl carrier protein of acetyl-CoA carboxylase, chloroplastic isoform X2 [Cryptomeria japonica]